MTIFIQIISQRITTCESSLFAVYLNSNYNRKAVTSELSCSFKLTFNRDIAFFHAFFHPSVLIFCNLTLI